MPHAFYAELKAFEYLLPLWGDWAVAIDRLVRFLPERHGGILQWRSFSHRVLFWCSLSGSADATISFLCFSAFCTRNVEIKVLVLRAFSVYAVTHWGVFWWWSTHSNPHPAFIASQYPFAIATSLLAMVWWTWLHPLQERNANGGYSNPEEGPLAYYSGEPAANPRAAHPNS